MTATEAPQPQAATLLQAYWPERAGARWWRAGLLAVVGSLLLVASAKLPGIPAWPVPISMQTFAVLVLGAAYGWRLGAATVVLYLAYGLAGLPVFANPGAGPAYFAGTTGGYLIGFALAAAAVGWLAERGWTRGYVRTALAMVAGNAVIYAFGLVWLYAVLVVFQGLEGWGMGRVVAAGMTQFLVGDAVKLVVAAALLPLAWRQRSRNS